MWFAAGLSGRNCLGEQPGGRDPALDHRRIPPAGCVAGSLVDTTLRVFDDVPRSQALGSHGGSDVICTQGCLLGLSVAGTFSVGGTMDARIRFVLRFIEEQGGTLQITPKQIGSLLGLGDTRVLRLFRTEVGTTLRRHLLEVRMARAARLLRNSNLPIKTIAFDCGYSLVW